MKLYVKVEKTTIVKKLDKVICDICKQEIEKENFFDASDVEIKAIEGESFPEGDFISTYTMDCCIECFMNKVRPLLENTFDFHFNQEDS